MGMKGIWVMIVVLAFFAGTLTTGFIVFADEAPKTLAEECAEVLEDDDDDIDLDGLFCLAIQSLNSGLFVQTDPTKPVLFLQVDPGSEAPALVVNDGTNDLFTVNKDGSIQIGSSTVVLNPDGTVTGGPLFLEAGSKVDGNLIVAPSPPCNNKDLAQLKGGNWKCSKPEDIGGAAPNVVVLHYEQKAVETVPQEIFFPELKQLAVWEIVRDPTFSESALKINAFYFDTSVYGQVRQISSSTSVSAITGWFGSTDVTFSTTGMNWRSIETIQASSRSMCCAPFDSTMFFSDRELEARANDFRNDVNFIAFGTRNDFSGTTAGEVKEFSGTMTIHFPPGQSLTRIL